MVEEGPDGFCRRAYPGLVRAMDLFCGDRDMAEEIVQESLLRACRRWRHVSQLQSPEGWCYRVGVNLATSRFRRRQVAARPRARVDGALRPASHSGMADVETSLVVREALAELTEHQRAVVVLRFFLDLDTHATAQVLESSPGAVRAATHRALTVLRGVLDVRVDEVEVGDVG